MLGFDYLIFGYREVDIRASDLSIATSILLRNSVPSVVNSNGKTLIKERYISNINALFSGRIEFTVGEQKGILGKIRSFQYKLTFIVSIFFALVISFLLSSIVWDIRVDGNYSITDSEIISSLSDCGFLVGSNWFTMSINEVETDFLNKNDQISWININRVGTVAYVKIMEKDEQPIEDKTENISFSNIVADRDCVVEEITVKRGTAVVKAGDAVKKGDLLILGVLPDESGGGFCSAEGEIMGRINESLTVHINKAYEVENVESRKIYAITLKLFNFPINIFKRYRNLANECDIIENEIKYTLFGKVKIPFSISIKHLYNFRTDQIQYTDEELLNVAHDRLTVLRSSLLSKADLVKMRTNGFYTENGYTLQSDLVFLESVGKTSIVKID